MKKHTTINKPFVLILYGPTGVGKTDLAFAVAEKIPAEIINIDVGQFYTPLSIGTAKPNWKNSAVPHHLFDIIDTPSSCTVSEYRTLFHQKISAIVARGNLPIVVGGSAFYVYSLFFQAETIAHNNAYAFSHGSSDAWQELYTIDPQRALAIEKTDTYRINRALNIWHSTGKLPSSYAPVYNPEIDFLLICLERDRSELHQRIDARVVEMLKGGWVEETQALMGTEWQMFIKKKGIIGYNEIFEYLAHEKNEKSYTAMIERIQAKTRQYAKRQITFWRKLEREIKEKNGYTSNDRRSLDSVNLTMVDIDEYSNQLLTRISFLLGKKL